MEDSHEDAGEGEARGEWAGTGAEGLGLAGEVADGELSVLLDRDWRAQTVGRIGSLPVRGAGRYEFRIHHRRDANCEWQLCAELPLELRVDDIEQ